MCARWHSWSDTYSKDGRTESWHQSWRCSRAWSWTSGLLEVLGAATRLPDTGWSRGCLELPSRFVGWWRQASQTSAPKNYTDAGAKLATAWRACAKAHRQRASFACRSLVLFLQKAQPAIAEPGLPTDFEGFPSAEAVPYTAVPASKDMQPFTGLTRPCHYYDETGSRSKGALLAGLSLQNLIWLAWKCAR
jgi:hypothetical protein